MTTTEDLFQTGRALWSMTNTAATTQVPFLSQMRERMTNPRPGDLVIEITSIFRATFDPDRVGVLIRHEGRSPEDRWVIAPYDRPDEEQGWQNAEFIAIPARGDGWPA